MQALTARGVRQNRERAVDAVNTVRREAAKKSTSASILCIESSSTEIPCPASKQVEGGVLGSIGLVCAGLAVLMVEVAGIEPVRTFGKPLEPLGSRTKSRDLSGPVGSRWVGLLTPSTWADFNR